MNDVDLNNFHIKRKNCRANLCADMKAEFNMRGPISKQRVLEAIEQILSSEQRKLRGYVVPHKVLLDEVEDKPGYLRAIPQTG